MSTFSHPRLPGHVLVLFTVGVTLALTENEIFLAIELRMKPGILDTGSEFIWTAVHTGKCTSQTLPFAAILGTKMGTFIVKCYNIRYV